MAPRGPASAPEVGGVETSQPLPCVTCGTLTTLVSYDAATLLPNPPHCPSCCADPTGGLRYWTTTPSAA